ncbi:hypothetical protein BC629DRAFT_1588652 [Irpex lacteus]|nr:hypothetical protein BC629DRAFT_1588652 [Irpex lacteus]
MSQFLQANDQPFSSLWLGAYPGFTGTQDDMVPPVPASYDELHDWAYVGLVDTKHPGQGRQLFYKNVGNGRTPVRVVLYGTIRDSYLTALGNWTGKEQDACWASRLVELDGSRHQTAFDAQAAALRDLARFARYSVTARSSDEAQQSKTAGHIRCQHRLFTKVHARLPKPVSTLGVGDDPENLASDIQDQWVVTASIELRKQGSNTNIMSATPLSFANGDFVEVEAAVDVIVRKAKSGRDSTPKAVELRFRPVRVTKLMLPEVVGGAQNAMIL